MDSIDRGIKFRIKRVELKTHLEKRARHHEERAVFYGKKAAEFAQDAEKVPNAHENRTLGRHEDEIGRSRRMHADTAKMFRFYASHLPAENWIRLTRQEITEMELLQ